MVCDVEAFAADLRRVRGSLEVALLGGERLARNEGRVLDDLRWYRIAERDALSANSRMSVRRWAIMRSAAPIGR